MKSLRKVLFTNFLIVAVVPIFVFSFFAYSVINKGFKSEIVARNSLLAVSLASEIDLFLEDSIEILSHMADIQRFENSSDMVHCEDHTAMINPEYKRFEHIAFMDPSGIILSTSPFEEELQGRDVSSEPYFEKPSKMFAHPKIKTFVKESEKIAATISIGVDGHLITGFLSLESLQSIVDQIKIGSTGYAALIDNKGNFIAGLDNSLDSGNNPAEHINILEITSEQKPVNTSYFFNRANWILSTASVFNTNWIVILNQQRMDAFAKLHYLHFLLAFVIIGSVLLGIVLALKNIHKILEPVHSLINYSRELKGAFYHKPLIEKSYGEINELADAFSVMAKAIEKREKNLQASEQNYKDLIENAHSIIIRWDVNGNYTFFNEYAEKFFGYRQKEIIGKPVLGYTVPEIETTGRSLGKMLKEITKNPEEYTENENEIITKEKKRYWIRWSNQPVRDQNGNLKEIVSVGIDITEKKMTDKKIADSLKEKEILLQEIHHRVKNNLQIISSLLSLQSINIKDKYALQLFQVSKNRIHSMAMIHEKLYQSDNLSEIYFDSYIRDLTIFLFDSYKIKPDRVKPVFNLEKVVIPIDTANPCALLVTEVISNSLKHAFSGGKGSRLIITLSKNTDLHTLTVSDDGVGIPKEILSNDTQTLGLKLIRSLSEQIGGSVLITGEGGATYTIKFPGLKERPSIE